MNAATDLALIAPELVLTLGGLIILMIGAFAGDRAVGLYQGVAAATLLVATACIYTIAGQGGAPFSGTLAVDAFSGFARTLIYAASLVCVLIAPRFFRGEMRAEYPALILFAALGMGVMASAQDMMTLYIGLELNSLAAYVLASFMRTDGRSMEAGLKYFVLGALASGILLYGNSLLYGFSGTTAFDGIAAAAANDANIGFLFGIVFVLAGLAFKIGAVPFHMWTPDVYEGAPTPVTVLFATAPKVAAIALLTRVTMESLAGSIVVWQQIVIFLALASIIVGAAGAIGQKNIKRLLAYSSINNAGFMLIGLAAGSAAGVAGLLFYLIVYVLTTLGSFLVVLQLRDARGEQVESIAALAGLSRKRPGLAAAMAVFLFSLAGIPPLFGFWPKYLVFEAAVAANLLPLAVAGIVASVIGAFYYIAIIKTMYFDAPSETSFAPPAAPLERAFIAASALVLSVAGYLLIPTLGMVTARAAGVLF